MIPRPAGACATVELRAATCMTTRHMVAAGATFLFVAHALAPFPFQGVSIGSTLASLAATCFVGFCWERLRASR